MGNSLKLNAGARENFIFTKGAQLSKNYKLCHFFINTDLLFEIRSKQQVFNRIIEFIRNEIMGG